MDYLEQIRRCGILPCLRAGTPEDLQTCVHALSVQGFPAAEIDCREDIPDKASWEALFHHPKITVGARVRDSEQGMRLLTEGCRWLTVPAAETKKLDGSANTLYVVQSIDDVLGVVDENGAANLPLLCRNIELANEIARVYPQAWLLLPGGWDAAQNRKRLAAPSVQAVRVDAEIHKGQAEAQSLLFKRLWAEHLELSLLHIGINGADAKDAALTAKTFAALLGMPYQPGNDSDFAGSIIEAMKTKGRGTHGHIGIATSDLARGMYFAQCAGFAFDLSSRKNDAAGNALLYYLEQEIGGFAVHFIQK